MSLTGTEYKYIQLNEQDVPIMTGSTMKVVELISSVQAYGWNPEELHDHYPHISLSQIYSALSYYWDHQVEIDTEITRIDQWAQQAREAAGESPIAKT